MCVYTHNIVYEQYYLSNTHIVISLHLHTHTYIHTCMHTYTSTPLPFPIIQTTQTTLHKHLVYQSISVYTQQHHHTYTHNILPTLLVYIHIIMYICNSVCVWQEGIHTHTHTHIHEKSIHTHKQTYIRIFTYIYICTRIHIHVCMYVCMYVCMHVCICISDVSTYLLYGYSLLLLPLQQCMIPFRIRFDDERFEGTNAAY